MKWRQTGLFHIRQVELQSGIGIETLQYDWQPKGRPLFRNLAVEIIQF